MHGFHLAVNFYVSIAFLYPSNKSIDTLKYEYLLLLTMIRKSAWVPVNTGMSIGTLTV